MMMTKQELNEYVSQNATDVADLAALDRMNKTNDSHLARVIQRQLSDKYEDLFVTAEREKYFPF